MSVLALIAGNLMAEKYLLVYLLPSHFLFGSQPVLDCLSPEYGAWACADDTRVLWNET